MVNARINLLKNRKVLSEKDYLREQQLFRYAVVGLTMVAVVTVAVSIASFVVARKLGGIEQEIATSSRALQGMAEANAQQVYLKSRLTLISAFLDDRAVSREAIQRIFSLAIPGASVSSVAFVGDNIVATTVNSRSVGVLNEVLSYYQADTGFFTQVVSLGVSRSKDGSYDMQLHLTIPKGAS